MEKKPNRSKSLIVCPQCQKEFEKVTAYINVAKKKGAPIYCGKACAGLGRRGNRSIEEKKEIKRLYDIEYRNKNRERDKPRKHEYFKRTYDPVKASIERKAKMHIHVKRLQNDKYRAYKKDYDKKYVAKKKYGEFWESALLVDEITDLYDNREIKQINGLTNKTKIRKRKWEQNRNNQTNLPPLL